VLSTREHKLAGELGTIHRPPHRADEYPCSVIMLTTISRSLVTDLRLGHIPALRCGLMFGHLQMGLPSSLDNEPDEDGKVGSIWRTVPFFMMFCVLWGILGFLTGRTERDTASRAETAKAALAREEPVPAPAAGLVPVPESRTSPAQTVAATPSMSALRSTPVQVPPDSAKDPLMAPESSAPVLPTGIAPVQESRSSPAQPIAVTASIPALRGEPPQVPADSVKEPATAPESTASVLPGGILHAPESRSNTPSIVPAVETAGFWPPNDPEFKNCVRIGNGITLKWQSTERANPSHVMVRQRRGNGQWETWIDRTPVKGADFTLRLRSAHARNSEFQWVLFQNSENIPPKLKYFCTRE
jgi:hypothetical protein